MSFVSDVMAPGGGILMLPFVKVVVLLLLATTISIFISGVAQIHMAILSFLSAGLLASLMWFEAAYKNQQQKQSSSSTTTSKLSTTSSSSNARTSSQKTD
mmetsp:Transcript_38074/g.56668  ORF Transcript_38074/g.56668 Transcript_38074/m.56668 type:complete len:100 (-) Transcript_38074:241-540(-)